MERRFLLRLFYGITTLLNLGWILFDYFPCAGLYFGVQMQRTRYKLHLLAYAVLAGGILALAKPPARAGAAPGIAVQGNQLVTTSAGTLGVQKVGAGVPVVLRGVNFSGGEYACLEKGSFWDKPQGNQATVNAMLTWHANVVRVPLNEDCWLGINGAPAKHSGANYIRAISAFVRLANASGLIVEVDLHYGAGGRRVPTSDDYPALDADHAPAFWHSVASHFKGNRSVIFNLINEPYGISWPCLRDGGCTAKSKRDGAWHVVGMQSVVNTVRATGAKNPIIIAGLDWSDDLTQWLYYVPHDPARQLIAGFHTYAPPLDSWCTTAGCWDRTLAPIQAAGYPLIIDEFGEEDCAHGYIDRVMKWADAQTPEVGYWAWAWTIAGCKSEPSLITDSAGNPTPYGAGFKTHLLARQ
jgi:endoglucanase